MRQLKENGLYELPDGRIFIARAGDRWSYLLHDAHRGISSAPIYLVDAAGQVLSWGRRTRWSIGDLRETDAGGSPQLKLSA